MPRKVLTPLVVCKKKAAEMLNTTPSRLWNDFVLTGKIPVVKYTPKDKRPKFAVADLERIIQTHKYIAIRSNNE